MKAKSRLLAASFASVLVVGACAAADDTDVGGAVDDAAETAIEGAETVTETTMGSGAAEATAKLQTTLDVMTSELETAEADPDLAVAWAEIQARVADAIVAIQSDPDFDMSDLESTLDSFESELAAVDPDIEVESAWAEFRLALDSFLDQFES